MDLSQPQGVGGLEAGWQGFWSGRGPDSEIQMWDFYGGRPWVLKHVPRHGKVLDAGCGLGRYVFLLSDLGIDIDGVDSSVECVEMATAWGAGHGFEAAFKQADVLELPYESDSLSGYISLGVVEHFAEGPHRALAEAYRVLRPGGIAVLSTPAVSGSQRYVRARHGAKRSARKVLGRPEVPSAFFQHWFSAAQLARFVEDAGLSVVLAGTCDLRYTLWEVRANRPSRDADNWAYRLADRLEATPLARLGAQSLVVGVKTKETMHCFLCGEWRVESPWHARTYLPVCARCDSSPLAEFYRVRKAPRFRMKYEYVPPETSAMRTESRCHFCGETFTQDAVFGQHGFSVPICNRCLAVPAVSITASNQYLKPLWGGRGARNDPQ